MKPKRQSLTGGSSGGVAGISISAKSQATMERTIASCLAGLEAVAESTASRAASLGRFTQLLETEYLSRLETALVSLSDEQLQTHLHILHFKVKDTTATLLQIAECITTAEFSASEREILGGIALRDNSHLIDIIEQRIEKLA